MVTISLAGYTASPSLFLSGNPLSLSATPPCLFLPLEVLAGGGMRSVGAEPLRQLQVVGPRVRLLRVSPDQASRSVALRGSGSWLAGAERAQDVAQVVRDAAAGADDEHAVIQQRRKCPAEREPPGDLSPSEEKKSPEKKLSRRFEGSR